MKFSQVVWTYLSGFVGGTSFALFIWIQDPAIVVVGASWLIIGAVARRIC